MIATADDVLNGFRVLWAAVAQYFEGGLHDWRAIPAVLVPRYAVVQVKPGERVTMTGDVFTESFTVTVWVHADRTDDRRAIGRALARIDWSQAIYPSLWGKCLHVKPMMIPDTPTPLPNLSRDMAVIPGAWEVLIQQTRPVGSVL